MSTVTPIQFFHTLFGEPVGPGQLVLWTKSSRGGSHYTYWSQSLDEAARLACRYRNGPAWPLAAGGALHSRPSNGR